MGQGWPAARGQPLKQAALQRCDEASALQGQVWEWLVSALEVL